MLKLWIYLTLLCIGITAFEEFNPYDTSDKYLYDYFNSDDYAFPIDLSSGEIDSVKTSKSGEGDLAVPEFIDEFKNSVVNENNKLPTDSLSSENEDSVKTTKSSYEDLIIPEFINELNNVDVNENKKLPSASLSEEKEDSEKTTKSSDEDLIIPEFIKELNNLNNANENNNLLDEVIDYQIEDNRSIGKDENDSNKDKYNEQNFNDDEGSFDLSDFKDVDKKSLSDEINEDINESNLNSEEQNITDKSNSEEIIQQILNDTKSILSEDTVNDFMEDSLVKDEANKNITTDYKTLIDETKFLLEETRGALDERSSIENSEVDKDSISSNNDENQENDNRNKGSDLIADLVELNDIKNKLNDFDDESDNFANENEDIISSEDNNDYEELDDTNLEQIFNNKETKKNEDTVTIHEVEPFPDDSFVIELTKKAEPIVYHNDDLLASDTESRTLETALSSTESQNLSLEMPKTSTVFTSEEVTISSNELISDEETKSSESIIDTKNMTDSQVDTLLVDFSNKNLKNLVSNAKSSNNPQRVWLSVDKPTVITSPGYPNPYQTDSITDWIFEGIGTGIEFNVTDCAINGHVGDYLLVKPGRIDDSGHDGLIFTFTLNTERRYRFFDVDRMFMRFEAKMGMQFMRGFSISARMLVPAPIINEPKPDPLPSVPHPEHTLTLNLGGISLEGFIEVEEQFRQIIADMATMFINANDINPGLNSTSDVTQITSRALCYHNWPKYEMCAEVRFGVPLILEEEETSRLDEDDLHNMWFEYSKQDPFAMRLRMLGITEFQVPNDHGVLLVWLVIAGGVVISMAMLAFSLWRFSCFEDYSRMPSYSDTDSLNEKRKLDMFPTPHQTLPALYTDADYKWVDNDEHCKVDIGGYSNRNFLEDDMFNIDSEDDVVSGRNRDNAIRPRDIYKV